MRSKRKVLWDSEGIKALRAHLGMTQQELADELGTRQQTISEWETGMYRPRGASATLLSIIAERADFDYTAAAGNKSPEDDGLSRGTESKPFKLNPGAFAVYLQG